jgi:hypothetical protein
VQAPETKERKLSRTTRTIQEASCPVAQPEIMFWKFIKGAVHRKKAFTSASCSLVGRKASSTALCTDGCAASCGELPQQKVLKIPAYESREKTA